MRRKIKRINFKKNFVIYNKSQRIKSFFYNETIKVYNGRTFFFLFIKDKYMLNERIGNFIFTRKMGNIHFNFLKKKNFKK